MIPIRDPNLDISVKICIKPGHSKREPVWHRERVNHVIKAMQRFRDATFLGRT